MAKGNRTSLWYDAYQCSVLTVPVFGTTATNHWYDIVPCRPVMQTILNHMANSCRVVGRSCPMKPKMAIYSELSREFCLHIRRKV
ncbi:MAG: hypothetical protein SPI30_00540 [Prevotella sp.]|nr:hypothetical protein [Prevotella sp.]